MTKQKTIFFVMIVSLVFNAAFLGGLVYRLNERSKKPKPLFPPPFAQGSFERRRPEIPEELREKMREIHKQYWPRMREIHDQLRVERNALLELLMIEAPDSTAIDQRLKRIGEFQLEIEKEVVHSLLRGKDFLPLEQRRQFLEMVTWRLGGSPRPPGMKHRRMRSHRKDEERIKER